MSNNLLGALWCEKLLAWVRYALSFRSLMKRFLKADIANGDDRPAKVLMNFIQNRSAGRSNVRINLDLQFPPADPVSLEALQGIRVSRKRPSGNK
jgi:hypothetical protein